MSLLTCPICGVDDGTLPIACFNARNRHVCRPDILRRIDAALKTDREPRIAEPPYGTRLDTGFFLLNQLQEKE